MKVNVLGTVYRIKYVPSLDSRGGEISILKKIIVSLKRHLWNIKQII